MADGRSFEVRRHALQVEVAGRARGAHAAGARPSGVRRVAGPGGRIARAIHGLARLRGAGDRRSTALAARALVTRGAGVVVAAGHPVAARIRAVGGAVEIVVEVVIAEGAR